MNSNFGNHQIDTLVMISNARGSHLFAKYGRDESPVFKIKAVHNEYGKPKIRLMVMEVVYPKDLYRELDSRAAVLRAIDDRMVVVKETQTMITFVPEMSQRILNVDLPEVDCVCCKLIVKSPVYVSGDCSQPITGNVEVEGNCLARNLFFISKEPSQGLLKLNQETGEWLYQTTVNGLERDTFEIVVWNAAGAWATQRTIVTCQPQPEVIDVNVLNDKLTVQVEEPLDVNVATMPPVVVRTEDEALAVDVVGIASVTIEGAVEVTGINVEIPEVMAVTTGQDGPLAVAVQGVPVVTVEGAVEVTGVDIEIPEVMTVTTAQDGPLAVAVQGVPVVTVEGAVEVTGVDIEIPEVMTVTTAEDAPLAVAVQGVPAVAVEGAVEVTGIDIEIPEIMTVTTAEDAPLAVAVTGVPTVTIDGPIKLSPYELYHASKNLPDIAVDANEQALFNTSKSIDQTVFVKIPLGVTATIQPLVVPQGDTEAYPLGDPIEKLSNYAFTNTSPAAKVGVEVSNYGVSTIQGVVVTMESHEEISED